MIRFGIIKEGHFNQKATRHDSRVFCIFIYVYGPNSSRSQVSQHISFSSADGVRTKHAVAALRVCARRSQALREQIPGELDPAPSIAFGSVVCEREPPRSIQMHVPLSQGSRDPQVGQSLISADALCPPTRLDRRDRVLVHPRSAERRLRT